MHTVPQEFAVAIQVWVNPGQVGQVVFVVAEGASAGHDKL